MQEQTIRLFSIGHSNRNIPQLVEILTAADIQVVVDIRATPGSKRHPQYNQQDLRASLEESGFIYHWAGRQLGGRRHPKSDSPHHALKVDAMRGFADHMESDSFERASIQLVNLAMKANTAMLCAERLPENCHRSLISDYLVLKGLSVLHLLDGEDIREHQLSPHARVESAALVYDRYSNNSLF